MQLVVAAYADSLGHEDYNQELGSGVLRAARDYMIGKKRLDPTQVA
jgi:hypothetical protein